MSFTEVTLIGSIEAARPVFLIVMGVFLMMVAWRLGKVSEGWTARLVVGGALLLAFGYAIMLPLYEAGWIEKYHPQAHLTNPAVALGWHAVKLVVMNAGWLFFGLGLGLDSGLLRVSSPRKMSKPQPASAHESIA